MPNSADTYYKRAVVRQLMGDNKGAQRDIEMAARNGMQFEEVKAK
jgi:hypothetical protein